MTSELGEAWSPTQAKRGLEWATQSMWLVRGSFRQLWWAAGPCALRSKNVFLWGREELKALPQWLKPDRFAITYGRPEAAVPFTADFHQLGVGQRPMSSPVEKHFRKVPELDPRSPLRSGSRDDKGEGGPFIWVRSTARGSSRASSGRASNAALDRLLGSQVSEARPHGKPGHPSIACRKIDCGRGPPLRIGRIGGVAGLPGLGPAVWARLASWVVRLSCPGREWRAVWCLPCGA